MNQELTDKLRKEFPTFLGPTPYADFLRGFGIECGDGWYELIREAAALIEAHNKLLPKTPVVALIIKEKFGGLQFQGLSNMNDFLWRHLRNIEAESFKTCDQCGKPGILRSTGYWLATRCEEHAVTDDGKQFLPVEEEDE